MPRLVVTPFRKPRVPAVVRKYQISWCIIQKTGQCTGCPEHFTRTGKSDMRSKCFQKHQGRLHGNKIPINNTATSWIAPQVKWFLLRMLLSVVLNDRNAARRIITILYQCRECQCHFTENVDSHKLLLPHSGTQKVPEVPRSG